MIEGLRRGIVDFATQTRRSIENVNKDGQALRTARDLLHQVKTGPLKIQEALEQIHNIEDKDSSRLVLHHFILFESEEISREVYRQRQRQSPKR